MFIKVKTYKTGSVCPDDYKIINLDHIDYISKLDEKSRLAGLYYIKLVDSCVYIDGTDAERIFNEIGISL